MFDPASKFKNHGAHPSHFPREKINITNVNTL